jgi:hypothetical protein
VKNLAWCVSARGELAGIIVTVYKGGRGIQADWQVSFWLFAAYN